MGRFAKVMAIDAVREFATALRCFGDEVSAVLDNLELEVRRALQWIQHDRKDYWKQQVRQGWDRVAEARANLERSQTFRRVADYRPSCREEKLALEKAKRRLRTAQEKVEVVRHWSRAVQHEVIEYKGTVSQLAGWLESDLPRALASLERMAGALESYVAVESSSVATVGSGSSLAAQGDRDLSPEVSPHEQQPPAGKTPDRPPAGTTQVGLDKGAGDENLDKGPGDENMGSDHRCRES